MMKIKQQFIIVLSLLCYCSTTQAQQQQAVWKADQGADYYRNPILHADYSDPDVVRAGADYYMVSSSFDAVPGLPVLHSADLVHWQLIGHALQRQPPYEHFSQTQHGNGVWAPSIRHYDSLFYIYYPDPDFGIYVTTARRPEGPWSVPQLVEAGRGLIDPCPLIDDDGSRYLVHAYAGSRAGIKSVLVLKRLNKEGNRVIDAGTIIYDGHGADPTLEGPKIYKRNGYYYILAPAGGVTNGWQLALRSRNIYGPYERKVVMDQGSTAINGPHKGAWVETPEGGHWFLHFQDKGPYGRVVHLQPLAWINDWPVIGLDKDKDGKGEPVLQFRKPLAGKRYPAVAPAESDEFNDTAIGLQWQWQANPETIWLFLNKAEGALRLYAVPQPDSARNAWDIPNILLQKWPAPSFTSTARLKFSPDKKRKEERCGLIVMGKSYAALGIVSKGDGNYLAYYTCRDADRGEAEQELLLQKVPPGYVYLRVRTEEGGICRFSYSLDGKQFRETGAAPFVAAPGQWIGAKTGLFASGRERANDTGFCDVDWFRVE